MKTIIEIPKNVPKEVKKGAANGIGECKSDPGREFLYVRVLNQGGVWYFVVVEQAWLPGNRTKYQGFVDEYVWSEGRYEHCYSSDPMYPRNAREEVEVLKNMDYFIERIRADPKLLELSRNARPRAPRGYVMKNLASFVPEGVPQSRSFSPAQKIGDMMNGRPPKAVFPSVGALKSMESKMISQTRPFSPAQKIGDMMNGRPPKAVFPAGGAFKTMGSIMGDQMPPFENRGGYPEATKGNYKVFRAGRNAFGAGAKTVDWTAKSPVVRVSHGDISLVAKEGEMDVSIHPNGQMSEGDTYMNPKGSFLDAVKIGAREAIKLGNGTILWTHDDEEHTEDYVVMDGSLYKLKSAGTRGVPKGVYRFEVVRRVNF